MSNIREPKTGKLTTWYHVRSWTPIRECECVHGEVWERGRMVETYSLVPRLSPLSLTPPLGRGEEECDYMVCIPLDSALISSIYTNWNGKL